MVSWYHLLFLIPPLAFLDAPPRIMSFSTPTEDVLHEPFNVVMNVAYTTHPVDQPAGVSGFLLQLPREWEVLHAYRASQGGLEELRRNNNLETFFQPENGYQLFGYSLLDLPMESDEMIWKVILTAVPRTVGSFPLKVISCSQFEDVTGHGWKAVDPLDFGGFRKLNAERYVEVVTVNPPQYNGGQAVALRTGSDAIGVGPVEVPLLGLDRDFTLEYWLKTASLDAGVFVAEGDQTEEAKQSRISLEIDAEGMPSLTVGVGDSLESETADVFVADGSWHHMAIVHRASHRSISLFMDGLFVDSLEVGSYPQFKAIRLLIGAGDRRGFTGMVDEFRVWSVARSSDQITHDMGRVLETSVSGLVGLYHFDEFSGQAAANELRGGLPDAHLIGKARFVASHSPAVREIFRLSAQLRGEEIELVWELSLVGEIEEFVVERRTEGQSFVEIGKVPVHQATGAGGRSTFSYVDRALEEAGVVRYRIRQVNADGTVRYSDEVKVGTGVPTEFTLEQNHPNPFNPSTTITYTLHVETHVRLKVYDLVGRVIAELVDQEQGPGTYAIDFNAENYRGLTSGIYFYKLETSRQSEIRKMILAK